MATLSQLRRIDQKIDYLTSYRITKPHHRREYRTTKQARDFNSKRLSNWFSQMMQEYAQILNVVIMSGNKQTAQNESEPSALPV